MKDAGRLHCCYCCYCCYCCSCGIALVLLAALVCGYFLLPWKAAQALDDASGDTTYSECASFFGRWEDVSLEKATSCCSQFGLGCRATVQGLADAIGPPQGTDLRAKYRCTSSSDSQTLWSRSKAAFCCTHEGLGCDTWQRWRHTSVWKHNCNEAANDWYYSWSSDRKAWCCQNAGRGCMLYRCEGIVADWSKSKREWCCRNAHNGCSTTVPDDLACSASCALAGAGHSCRARIRWTAEHVFTSSPQSCQDAHRKVLAECAGCQGCQLQSAC